MHSKSTAATTTTATTTTTTAIAPWGIGVYVEYLGASIVYPTERPYCNQTVHPMDHFPMRLFIMLMLLILIKYIYINTYMEGRYVAKLR